MRKNQHTLGIYLQQFFTHYLQEQRNVSSCTTIAYRDTFRLLLSFMHKILKKCPAELALTELDANTVLAFLNYLEKQRGNSPRTRNTRLAAIRSFMTYVSFKDPTRLAQCEQILAIPVKRFEKPLVGFIEREPMDAILCAPSV
ncbi:site-specific integrase, partial [Granulosicoccus sp.]